MDKAAYDMKQKIVNILVDEHFAYLKKAEDHTSRNETIHSSRIETAASICRIKAETISKAIDRVQREVE